MTPPAGPCGGTIKGTIASDGERIYHLLGSRDDARTRVDDRAGEHLFRSDDEAEAAGWRPTRN
ncbi:nuclease [Methylobacterium iners]|uniref:nuclease n=1 Tax=Methylobacterium iners TaxID=418707 RepID=UPI001EE240FA|nr:nuclease [Methylobacterium iners]